jgi:hypothetical protein
MWLTWAILLVGWPQLELVHHNEAVGSKVLKSASRL